MNFAVHAATASLPGVHPRQAIAALEHGLSEPYWGAISVDHVQICPQNPGYLSEELCEQLRGRFPCSRLRLHANARAFPQHVRWDLSCFSEETRPYFEALADRSRRLGAPAYSLHAGYLAHCSSWRQLMENYQKLQEIFGDIPVGIEGLYPLEANPQWVGTWREHEALLNSRALYALDISHLQIIARTEGWQWDLVEQLLLSPQCLEVHVSDNDGKRDQHALMSHAPSWQRLEPLIEQATQKGAVVFTEGDQLGRGPQKWQNLKEKLAAAGVSEFQ